MTPDLVSTYDEATSLTQVRVMIEIVIGIFVAFFQSFVIEYFRNPNVADPDYAKGIIVPFIFRLLLVFFLLFQFFFPPFLRSPFPPLFPSVCRSAYFTPFAFTLSLSSMFSIRCRAHGTLLQATM